MDAVVSPEIIWGLILALCLSTLGLSFVILFKMYSLTGKKKPTKTDAKDPQSPATFEDMQDIYTEIQTLKTLSTNLVGAIKSHAITVSGNGNGHKEAVVVGVKASLQDEMLEELEARSIPVQVQTEEDAQPVDIPTPEEQVETKHQRGFNTKFVPRGKRIVK